MLMVLRTIVAAALMAAVGGVALGQEGGPGGAFPVPTAENKLWTRWWWMGSAVDRENLTAQMEAFGKAGLGGVEICPIYGVNGMEAREVKFLTPEWMNLLVHTTREGQRVGVNVDLTCGTGWPFGGPMVSAGDASAGLNVKVFEKMPTPEEFPKGKVIVKQMVSPDGKVTDITNMVDVTSARGSKFVVASVQETVQKVKRPAPGGEGWVLDPYSVDAMGRYLEVFDKAMEGFQDDLPRAYFHDSFEYYGASWTPKLFEEFQARRGYDLKPHLAALAGAGDADVIARVRHDYRETLSDLHQAYMDKWTAWTHTHGGIARNQAHGGPGNLIDVYAGADIPECEIFHLYDESQMPFLKLASSAAHVTGKKLASSESFTWLDEHFNVTLAEVKKQTDFLFLTGTNHLFLHGIPYSPKDAGWPGWNFYASVNFGPNGGLWHNMPAFAAYVARCQSILQANKPGNEVLLYMPWHDFWTSATGGREAETGGLMVQFTTPGTWMKPFPAYGVATGLWEKGIGYDSISDKLLMKAEVGKDGRIVVGGNAFKVLVLPKMSTMPVETMEKVAALAKAGGTVVVEGKLPTDVPGFGDLAKRRAALQVLDLQSEPSKGAMVEGEDVHAMLVRAGVKPEKMVERGLRFIRRAREDGWDYFVVNRGEKAVETVPLAEGFAGAEILDPRFSDRAGVVKAVRTSDGSAGSVALTMQPGEAYFIRTYTEKVPEGKAWQDWTTAGAGMPLGGTWSVAFVEGGPKLPAAVTMEKLAPWTSVGGEENQAFSGTAKYTLKFAKPAGGNGAWRLDLGKVADAAKVTLNGKVLGNLWSEPYSAPVGDALKDGENVLEVEVTNVAANRIRDMDKKGVKWKIFKDINIVTTGYKPLDAATWPVREAGLLGPVMLVPLKK